jgi:predicted nucleotidyltransferase
LDLLKDFFKDRDNYAFILLFGSQSSDSASENSDVDIGLFFKDSVDYMALGYESAKLESLLNKKIDMIVLNDIYKKDPLLSFEILSSHNVLLLNDEDSFISFKRSSQLSYLDHKPLIKMNQKALLDRIEANMIGERSFVIKS